MKLHSLAIVLSFIGPVSLSPQGSQQEATYRVPSDAIPVGVSTAGGYSIAWFASTERIYACTAQETLARPRCDDARTGWTKPKPVGVSTVGKASIAWIQDGDVVWACSKIEALSISCKEK